MSDTLETNKSLVLRLIEAMDLGQLSSVDSLCSADCVAHYMGRDLGRAQMKEAATRFHKAFPDLTHSVKDLVAEGDRVVLHSVDSATHRGIYRRIPPTNIRVQFETMAIYRLANGLIVEIWQLMDSNGLLKQIDKTAT